MQQTLSIHAIYADSAPPQTAITPNLVSQIFPATPLANIAANLPHVLAALTAANLADTPMLLVALATIRAEAEPFLPLTEQPCHFNTSPNGAPFDLYDRRKDLGNLAPPDGDTFRGRGFVQLTGRANYAQFAREINRPLLTNPDLAADPAIAAQLLSAQASSATRNSPYATPSPPTTSPPPAAFIVNLVRLQRPRPLHLRDLSTSAPASLGTTRTSPDLTPDLVRT